jgi:phosphoadenosine phosphosulfate reductase
LNFDFTIDSARSLNITSCLGRRHRPFRRQYVAMLTTIDSSNDRVSRTRSLLRDTLTGAEAGRVALVSSFGADSAVLLAMTAEIDPDLPVLFLDTGKHFPETLAHRDHLVALLGLRDVRIIHPDAARIARRDPDGRLHAIVPDDCCDIRKVGPLEQALAPFKVWITGRRREQASTRAGLATVEHAGGRIKINPMADWTDEHVAAEMLRRDLPAHPLVTRGFRSIGCAPCTRAVRPGEPARAGRWDGHLKVECGIHQAA